MTGWRAGQVAEAAGVNLQTLRYYERRGLLEPSERTLGGHRVYSPEAVTRLRVIKAAQRVGFTLAEVAELLAAGAHRHGGRGDAGLQARAAAKLVEVDKKIANLRTKATTETGEKKTQIDANLPIIDERRTRFNEAVKSLEQASAGTWDEAKNLVEKRWDELKDSVESAT